MTRSKVKVKVTRPLKLEIVQFLISISPAIFNVSWQMTTDSETTEQYLTFVRSRFLISVLVVVSRDFELGMVSVQFMLLQLQAQSRTMQTAEHEHSEFKLNSLAHQQPMKVVE